MGKRDDRFIIILDINRIFTTEDIAIVKEMERIKTGAEPPSSEE